MEEIEKITSSIEESVGYGLKTNEELIDMISEFGHGELEFDTADIERLIKESELLRTWFTKNKP